MAVLRAPGGGCPLGASLLPTRPTADRRTTPGRENVLPPGRRVALGGPIPLIWDHVNVRLSLSPAGVREALELTHDALQLVEQWAEPRVVAAPGLGVEQGAVVPEGALPAAGEAAPERLAEAAVVGEDGAGVVELVGGGDDEHGGRRVPEMGDVGFLPCPPGRFGDDLGVGAAIDDGGDGLAEALAEFLPHGIPAAVLD